MRLLWLSSRLALCAFLRFPVMKTKFTSLLFAAFLAATPALAIKVDLTGYAAQPTNSGNAIEPWMALLVSNYNAVNADLPTTPGSQVFRVEQGDPAPNGFPSFPSNIATIQIPGGYDYVALHWGGQGGGTYQAFYVGGTVNNFSSPSQNGLSWYAVFRPNGENRVPDSGSTLILLGLAIAALAPLSRRLRM